MPQSSPDPQSPSSEIDQQRSRPPGDAMIKTILVPATGSSADDAVFTAALAVARAFSSHLNFLHVRVDAASMAITMASEGGGSTLVGGLVDRLDEEADLRERQARELFDRFCAREGLATRRSATRSKWAPLGAMDAADWGRTLLDRRARSSRRSHGYRPPQRRWRRARGDRNRTPRERPTGADPACGGNDEAAGYDGYRVEIDTRSGARGHRRNPFPVGCEEEFGY